MKIPKIGNILPSGKWRWRILALLLFAVSVSLPFFLSLPGSGQRDSPPREVSQTSPSSPTGAPGRKFDPQITEGGFAISKLDQERSEWSWFRAKELAREIWTDPRTQTMSSFYCGCEIHPMGSTGGRVDLQSCGVEPRRSVARANRLEWEHIVPASIIGAGRSCWDKGAAQCVSKDGKSFKGRACCEIADPDYNMAATDPVNLAPSVGEINGDRSNYIFGIIQGERRDYGACNMEIDRTARIAEPPDERRGDIARVWAYMSKAYGLPVSREQADLYRQWMIDDPVSREEYEINEKIRASGHRGNPFVLQEAVTGQPSQ